MTVLVVGEALVDVVQRDDGTSESHAGGSPYNVARGLARLGVESHLACQFADDENGRLLAEGLEESRVGHSGPDPSVHRTSTALATLDADGAASFLFEAVRLLVVIILVIVETRRRSGEGRMEVVEMHRH